MSYLVDTHAHLNLDPLYDQWPVIVSEAVLAGVEQFIVPSADIPTSQRAIEIAQQDHRVRTAVGIHPEAFREQSSIDCAPLRTLCADPTVVAIGEIGIDYYFPELPKAPQLQLFRDQLILAKEFDLPVIIHTRTAAAMDDAVSIIESSLGSRPMSGVFHCFTGDRAFYERIRDLGFMVGVGGMITYDHQRALQEVVSTIPLESIILETDAPWLTPRPLPRGTNTPANVTIVAVKLASLLDVPVSLVLDQTTTNTTSLFFTRNHTS
jgi:TatD DNase family protein